MEMSVGEIKRIYDQSKNKERQIGILADLNCCTRDAIVKILDVECSREKPSAHEQKLTGIDAAEQALYAVLDDLESEIRSLEEEYKSVKKAIDVLAERKEGRNHGKETFDKAGNHCKV